MRILFILYLLILGTGLLAQKPISNNWLVNGEGKYWIGTSFGANAAADGFTNAFLKELVLTDQLSDETIANQLSRLDKERNTIGLDYEWSLHGGLRIKSSAHSLLFGVSDAAHLHASVSRNLARLFFTGNKSTAGDTVNLKEAAVNGTRYQQLSIGWRIQPRPSTSFYTIGSYVNGEQLAQMNINRGWLYTSELGDTVGTSLKGDLLFSDTANVGFAANNGNGMSLDFGFKSTFDADQAKWVMNAEVRDLGFVLWNRKTLERPIDTAYTWTGVEIEDITAVNNQFANDQVTDSLVDGVTNRFRTGEQWLMLPGFVHVSVLQTKSKGWETGGGWVYRWRSNFTPYVYLTNGYRFNEHIATHFDVGYGGYGKFQAGLSAVFQWSHFNAAVEIRNLEAIVVQSRFGGAGAILHLNYSF